jgi:hypothetical protein
VGAQPPANTAREMARGALGVAASVAAHVASGAASCALLCAAAVGGGGRGLHSSTFQLNLSALYGIEVARSCSVTCVKGVLGGV